jgi:iron(III) transport system ATP-binding protein
MQWLSVNQVVTSNHERPFSEGISFSMQRSERLGIAGETGAGKSSLLKMVAGLLQPAEGNIIFEDKRVEGPEEKLLPGHRHIAYLSQHFELLNHYRVEEYLALSNILEPDEALSLFSLCGIDHVLKRKTSQLSGGERQRVALANALVKRPRLLLLDEPFSNLDFAQKENIKKLLTTIERSLSVSSLIVSHDAADLLSWADRILLIQNGQIVQQGSPSQLYLHPLNSYCAGLLGPYMSLSVEWLTPMAGTAARPTNSKIVYARPEQFMLDNQENNSNSFLATVEAVYFLGPFSLVEVVCRGERIKVSVPVAHFEIGQQVYLSLREWVW